MKITNELNLPQPFVSAVESDHKFTPGRYSTTELLKGVREVILRRRHDDEIESDVADMMWLIFGTAVHSILENAEESATQLKENKIVIPLESGYELSGIFDLYDDATGTVTDYKTASVWKVIYDEWDDYKKQVLIYCWLLRKIGFDAKRGEIGAMLKDHSKTKAEVEANYPPHPLYVIGWDFTEADFNEIDGFIKTRFAELEAAEKLPDEKLPLCTKEERWGKDDKWAVTKKGNKRAEKLHNTPEDAEAHAKMLSEQQGCAYEIQYRPGEDTKCLKYCSCREFCDHYKQLVGDAE